MATVVSLSHVAAAQPHDTSSPPAADSGAPTAAQPPSTTPPAPAPAGPPTAAAPAESPASRGTAIELTSLRLMRDKGMITAVEYEAASREIAASIGDRAADANTLVLGRWSTTLYGFLKADYIYDSTQSFSDVAGNALVERPAGAPPPPPYPPTNYKGEHDRTTFSVRNSRFGFLMRAPEDHGIRATGQLEIDLFGNAPPVGAGVPAPQDTRLPYDTTENVTFSQPGLRLRHANVRLETPIVDILFGQYWHLFGWQNVYQPGMVQAQGGAGHLYGRAAQLRISRAFKSDAVTVELAAAALRPPARDSVMPDLQAGLRVALPGWTGVHTGGSTSTNVMPASLAITGDLRQFNVPEFDPLPTRNVSLSTQSFAIDAFLPVIPAKVREGNALSVHGEFVYGSGIADLYTGLTGGAQMPTVANTTGLNPPPQYPQNVDNGLVTFDLDGSLHAIKWTTFLVGLQYTLPGLGGKVWLAANYSRQITPNLGDYTRPYASTLPNPQAAYYPSAAQVRKSLEFIDASLFAEVVPSVRLGLEYARTMDHYVDGVDATNNRVQTAAIFLF
jgi:hypothetical protein